MNSVSAPQWVSARRNGSSLVFGCSVCGEQAAGASHDFAAFARRHSAHQSHAAGYHGLGDVVARGTKALGIESCSPCEKRRMMLNGLAPRVWRR